MITLFATLWLVWVGAATAVPPERVEFSEGEVRRILGHTPMPDLPMDPTNAVADDLRAAELGHRLFFDERLSANGAVSCATCHDPELAFADGRPLAEAIGTATRHTPTVLNAAHNRWFFWDGRADTLWAQAVEPIENPVEHGASRTLVARTVRDDPALRAAYEALFGPLPALPAELPVAARPVPDAPDDPGAVAWMALDPTVRAGIDDIFANTAKAIAAYERRLVTGEAPFDRFARALADGDEAGRSALSAAQQRGLKLFVGRANCRLCHGGPLFSDGEFHNTGVPPLGGGTARDPGRYDGARAVKANPFGASSRFSDAPDGATAEQVTALVRSSEQWGQFKTPSLRNVALTAPYMHQGQLPTLEAVVTHYATLDAAQLGGHHQEQLLVPLDLTDQERADLRAFLDALTGAMPDEGWLRAPER